MRKEGQKLLDEHIEAATEGKGMKWLQKAKRLAARPGDDSSSTFSLPDHVNRNLTAKESAEEIALYFSKISQEFKPIEEDSLPNDLEEKLETEECEHPHISEHHVYENMKKAKKTNSVPGDIPAVILK